MTHRTAGVPTTFTELQVHLQLSQNCRFTCDFQRTAGTPMTHRTAGTPMTHRTAGTPMPSIDL